MEVTGDEGDQLRIRPTSCNGAKSEQFIGYNSYAEIPNNYDSAHGTIIPCTEPKTRYTIESSEQNGVLLIVEDSSKIGRFVI